MMIAYHYATPANPLKVVKFDKPAVFHQAKTETNLDYALSGLDWLKLYRRQQAEWHIQAMQNLSKPDPIKAVKIHKRARSA